MVGRSVLSLAEADLEHDAVEILYRDAVLLQFAQRMGKEFKKDFDYDVWLSFDHMVLDTDNPFRQRLMRQTFHAAKES